MTRTSCERGHTTHRLVEVPVHLGATHGFHDYPQVPERLAKAFTIYVYARDADCSDPRYCPACDAFSEMVVLHGMWEPQETILASQVCSTIEPDQIVIDMGAHCGWYSLIAAAWLPDVPCPERVWAIDADQESLTALQRSLVTHGWVQRVHPTVMLLDEHTEWDLDLEQRVRFAKVDVEGAENHALRLLWPSIMAGNVDHLLVEITPQFGDYYPELVEDIIAMGFTAYRMPPKYDPPIVIDPPWPNLEPYRIDFAPDAVRGIVGAMGQENVWFKREGAAW